MLSVDYAKRLVGKTKLRQDPYSHDGSGVNCRYWQLNSRWGVKVYPSKTTRDRAYNRQASAADYNLAPAVGPKFSLKVHGENRHCFITQHVKTFQGDDATERAEREYAEEMAYLRQDLWDCCGYDWGDNHGGNIGIMPDGKVVCIDFVTWDGQ